MKVFKIVMSLTTLFGLILLALFLYYGGFSEVTPSIQTVGGETLVYENVKGDYAQSAAVSDRVYERLRKEFEIESTKGFGIFYNKPGTVESYELISEVGCIIEAIDSVTISDIKTELLVKEFPIAEYIVVEFPIKGKISFFIGSMKVYPALETYTTDNGYKSDTPVMEIWDIPNWKIIYRKEVARVSAGL